MITRYYPRFFLLFMSSMMMTGCITPYEFETDTYEEVLVVEAEITNEHKVQRVQLSRSFPIGDEVPIPETGALVRVSDDNGNMVYFQEIVAGTYESVEPFGATQDRTYTLHIGTHTGNYESDAIQMAVSTEIDSLYAKRTSYRGEDGVALLVDNFNPPQATRYFRYRFEETYKIVSRLNHDSDLIYQDGKFIEVLKTKEETTCYNTLQSQDIILASTTSLEENNLEGFLVRFIDSQNPIGSRRYSILVKQYSLTPQAYAYYEARKKLSGSDNVFSQNQPGFVAGNIFNLDDPEEKVVGMFNVSPVSSKRIYFNYSDFYGQGDIRPYFTDDCEIGNPQLVDLPNWLQSGRVKYMGATIPASMEEGPYKIVNAECVDCTLLGTNVAPDFWEEE